MITETSDMSDALVGAVIERLEAGDTGLNIVLADGRVLMFPDAMICAVYRPERVH